MGAGPHCFCVPLALQSVVRAFLSCGYWHRSFSCVDITLHFEGLLMWISLDRLAQCNRQERFLLHIPDWLCVQEFVCSSLTPAEGYLLLRTCLALYVERKDLFLSATAIRLGYSASGFSVRTPPLQPFLPLPVLPLAAGQGGVWEDALEDDDLDTISDTSSR